jgi:hypothetical protein
MTFVTVRKTEKSTAFEKQEHLCGVVASLTDLDE